ncbi:MAG: C26 family cysteine hydrolase domain-containing family [Clostridiales bacterium]|nr:C26 family cysteine hydrolase domain-containing family [Clostridiales bacterium]
MKKLIAITQRVEYIEAIKERRDALSQEWAVLAAACGFTPLLLPNHLPTVRELLAALPVEGVLLTGGNDLCAYGGDAPERDEVERFLLQWAIEKKIPLLGVCRGMQMVLDHFGTPLQRVEGHVRVQHTLDSGDTVNSFHSWGAVECRVPLVAEAWSTDGILEAVTHRDFPWIRGIMWHPERYHPLRPEDTERIKEVFAL